MAADARLIEAAQQGNLAAADAALADGADPNTRDAFGQTVLCQAILNRRIEVALRLLERGADPSLRGSMARPMAAAASQGLLEIVSDLLKRNAEIDDNATTLAKINGHEKIVTLLAEEIARRERVENERAEVPIPPLLVAIDDADLAAVRHMLAIGANPNEADGDGRTPLTVAAMGGPVEMIQALLLAGARVDLADPDGWTPLMFASRTGNVAGVKTLLAAKPVPNAGALVAAADGGSVEILDALIASGLDVNGAVEPQRTTALMIASRAGDLGVAKFLLAKGADVNAAGSGGLTPLLLAARDGHFEVVMLLLERGAAIDAREKTGASALLSAAGGNHGEVVKALLTHGARLDAVESEVGANALLAAAIAADAEIVKLLVDAGMDVLSRTEDGFTPLHYAAARGEMDSVKALLAAKAPVDAENKFGETPLLRAAAEGSVDAVAALLDAGADIDHFSTERLTPLMLAADKGHAPVARLLIDRGADAEMSSLGLRKAYDYARIAGHTEIEAMLKPPPREIPKVARPAAISAEATKALLAAIWIDDLDAAAAALAAGAAIDRAGDDVPIVTAAHAGSTDIVRLLIENGAEIDATDASGLTALCKACGGSQVDMARVLIEHGAKISGDVIACASINGHAGILALLESTGP